MARPGAGDVYAPVRVQPHRGVTHDWSQDPVAAPTRRARVALMEMLRQVRRDADLTGTALAQQLGAGWGQPKVSKIESGRQLPSADDVEAWAEATGANAETLLALHARALHEYETLSH